MLNEQELLLIKNEAILKLKTTAIKKIEDSLRALHVQLELAVKQEEKLFEEDSLFSTSKIARGENYLGLPFLVLDYPSHFSKPSIFAYRSLFWWGNFFSFTLHLQGAALEKYRAIVLQNCDVLFQEDWFMCIHESPWHYHYESDNYKKVNEFSKSELKDLIREKSFLKISYKLELDDYARLEEIGLSNFMRLLSLLRDTF